MWICSRACNIEANGNMSSSGEQDHYHEEPHPLHPALMQGCQMVCFQTENPDLVLDGKMLLYFIAIWNILRRLDIFYGPLVMLVSFGIFFPRIGIFYQKNLATLLSCKSLNC
jgi:hypothetical protein